MDATGVAVNRQREDGSRQKPHQRLPLGRVLDPAHRHPQSRKHRGGIGEEGFEALRVPAQTFVARLAQHRRIVERRDRRRSARPITPARLGPGRPRSAGSRLWQARQGVNARAPPSSAAAAASQQNRQQQQDREQSHAGATVWITTRRSVPDSPPQVSPGRPSSCRTLAPGLSLGKALNFSVDGIEAHDRVGAEIGEPDLVLVVDIDRIGARIVARQLPGLPGAVGGIVHRHVAAVPFADPDPALGIRPHPARALVRRRRFDHGRRCRSPDRSWRCDCRRARRTRRRPSA